jgi:nitrate reductase NapD
VNISSLVVHVRPEQRSEVELTLQGWPGIEIHASTPEGRLVVTVDTDDESTESFDRIGALPGVMSVAMVYHHLEPEQEQESQDGTDAT